MTKYLILDDIRFEYYNDDNLACGNITNIYYQNEELGLYYSTYWHDAQNELEIIEAIKSDFKTRK